MDLDVKFLDENPSFEQEWDEYVLRHEASTFFHLTGWQKVLRKTFKYPSFSCFVMKEGKVCGILPLFLTKTLKFKSLLISTPLAVYGGPFADDDRAVSKIVGHAMQLSKELGVNYLELRNMRAISDLPVKDLYVTFRKEISGDNEENMAAIPRKQRRMIRKGEKAGLTSKVGGMEFLDQFYNVYSRSVKNLGTPVFPKDLFRNLLNQFGDSCRILGVFMNDRMVAGVMTFFFRNEILPYYGGALKETFRYAVNDFMYWRLMCYGAERGCRIFDFGRSKKGTGPYDFKRHWGFEPTPLMYQYHLVGQKELPDVNPLNPSFSLPIRLWKKLPLKMTQWLGPRIVRYFP